MTARIHVMAAALVDAEGRILIARRPAGVHQGGLWEFPGGKREAGESREQALARELEEELGVKILGARPLISIAHDYPQRPVLLDVWRVTGWQGKVVARERQPLAWVYVQELRNFSFPPADVPVLLALGLPRRYLITPPPGPDFEAWLAGLDASLGPEIGLVQIRAPGHCGREFEILARQAVAVCRQHNRSVRVLINSDPVLAMECGADGVHYNHQRLWNTPPGAVATGQLLGVSCHGRDDLQQAAAQGADFAVLGPVSETRSHPGAPVLGWPRFEQLLREATVPVYALGGMRDTDLEMAARSGGQGIAAISAFWKGAELQ